MNYLQIKKNLDLHYSVNSLALVEKETGQKIGEIVDDLEAGQGSLTALRALVAAGWVDKALYAFHPHMGSMVREQVFDLGAAGRLIEREGVAAVASVVGDRLGNFLRQLHAQGKAGAA